MLTLARIAHQLLVPNRLAGCLWSLGIGLVCIVFVAYWLNAVWRTAKGHYNVDRFWMESSVLIIVLVVALSTWCRATHRCETVDPNVDFRAWQTDCDPYFYKFFGLTQFRER